MNNKSILCDNAWKCMSRTNRDDGLYKFFVQDDLDSDEAYENSNEEFNEEETITTESFEDEGG